MNWSSLEKAGKVWIETPDGTVFVGDAKELQLEVRSDINPPQSHFQTAITMPRMIDIRGTLRNLYILNETPWSDKDTNQIGNAYVGNSEWLWDFIGDNHG